MVAVLVYGLIGVVLEVVTFLLLGGATAGAGSDYGTSDAAAPGTARFFVLVIVVFVAVIFAQAAYLSGLLDIADGRPVTVGSFFRPRHLVNVLLTAALLSVISVALHALSFIPPAGLFSIVAFLAVAAFSFFTWFSIAFATDRGLSAFDALKASFMTVRSNVGGTALSWLLKFLHLVIGALLCGVGLIVGGPVGLLIQVYAYRRLSGGPIAPIKPRVITTG